MGLLFGRVCLTGCMAVSFVSHGGNKSSFSAPEAWSSFTPYLWAGSEGFEWLWPLWPLLAPTGLQPSSCSSFQSSTLPSTPSLQRQEEQHPSGPKNWPPGQGHNTTGIIQEFPHERWSMARRREKDRKSGKLTRVCEGGVFEERKKKK